MSTTPARRRAGPQVAMAALLAVATAACWWAWMGWDQEYQRDPATGAATGPYEPWQVAGCVVSLVAIEFVALRRLAVPAVLVVLPVAFTVAWSITAASRDTTGLWAVGATLVFLGTVLGAVLAAVAGLAWRRHGNRSR